MPDTGHHAALTLVFEGLTADDHEVPANLFAQAIAGMQRAIFLLAMEYEQVDVRLREKTPRHIEEKYALLVSPPSEGSVQIATRVGAVAGTNADDGASAVVAGMFEQLARGVEAGDEISVMNLVRDRVRRHRLLESVRSMLPKTGAGVLLRIEGRDRQALLHSSTAHRTLPLLVPRAAEEQSRRTVTGRLVRIQFDEKRLTIIYEPTGRELDCIYEEAIERTLLEHPRDLIQVTGTVVLDDAGEPRKIIDVEEIQELDMSPFYLSRVDYPTRTLEFKDVRVFEPELTEDQQLLLLSTAELGIDVYAATRDDLYTALLEEIDLLWRNYALAPDDDLSDAAVRLKQNLLATITEIPGAAG